MPKKGGPTQKDIASLMNGAHGSVECVCGNTLMSCRCPGPKEVRAIVKPCFCDNPKNAGALVEDRPPAGDSIEHSSPVLSIVEEALGLLPPVFVHPVRRGFVVIRDKGLAINVNAIRTMRVARDGDSTRLDLAGGKTIRVDASLSELLQWMDGEETEEDEEDEAE